MDRKVIREKCLIATMLLIVFGGLGLNGVQPVLAAETPILYFFWGDGCPHCEEEKEFLEILREEYPQLEMRWFEVWDHPQFAKLADALRKAYGEKISSVPMTVIGNWMIIGFRSYEETGTQIAEQVKACLQKGCRDALDRIGPLMIVAKIRDEIAKNAPQEWEYYPATTPEQEKP